MWLGLELIEAPRRRDWGTEDRRWEAGGEAKSCVAKGGGKGEEQGQAGVGGGGQTVGNHRHSWDVLIWGRTMLGAFMTMVLCPVLVVAGVVSSLCGLLRLATPARVCSASVSRCRWIVRGAETWSERDGGRE